MPGVRRPIHTGLPCHSTPIIMPGSMALTSTLIGAPAALARSLGIKLNTNGAPAPAAATPPAVVVAAIKSRRLLRSTLSVISLIPSVKTLFIVYDPGRHCDCTEISSVKEDG